ncbi:MAG TPA: TRAP transporter small permease, partial [Beijerinckiaceae bacterium]|nr:TRAP transporter small permease [Beijerinckiaceae bacterium]
MLVLLALGIFVRLVPVFSMSGYDEVIELLVAWTVFVGAVALWREGSLFKVELIDLLGSARLARAADLVARLLMLAFAVVFLVEGWEFTVGSIETMPFLFVSKQPWYAAMPVAGALMTAYGIAGVVQWWFGRRPLPAEPPATQISV